MSRVVATAMHTSLGCACTTAVPLLNVWWVHVQGDRYSIGYFVWPRLHDRIVPSTAWVWWMHMHVQGDRHSIAYFVWPHLDDND